MAKSALASLLRLRRNSPNNLDNAANTITSKAHKTTPEKSLSRKCSSMALAQAESLERILSNKELWDLFHRWAADNLCSENLSFYKEVETFSSITDPVTLKSEAFRIYTQYVHVGAPSEINLDYDYRCTIEDNLQNPSQNLFDEAKFAVLDLMKLDLYIKFIDSDIYRTFKGLPSAHKHQAPPRKNVHLAELPHLTYEQISSLANCLRDPLALDEFLKFTYKEMSDAIVQFYLDVDRYELYPTLEFAYSIYHKYLGKQSKEEVDADPKIKGWIWTQLQLGLCPHDLFKHLKAEVYSVMAQDNFMRFQNYVISSQAVVV